MTRYMVVLTTICLVVFFSMEAMDNEKKFELTPVKKYPSLEKIVTNLQTNKDTKIKEEIRHTEDNLSDIQKYIAIQRKKRVPTEFKNLPDMRSEKK